MNKNKGIGKSATDLKNDRSSTIEKTCIKPPVVNVKKQGLFKPVHTKSSMHRQNLALNKKMQAVSLIPDEVLFCVFKFISMSDLLRCCCVSKMWKAVAEIQSLWECLFKRLPKRARDLSSKARTTGNVDWKKECIHCVKERHSRVVKKISKDSISFSKKSKLPHNYKTLHIRWLLTFVDSASNYYQAETNEDFVFNIGVSVRWNEVDMPPLSKMTSVKLYALTPVLLDENLNPVEDSICTRSLIMVHSFEALPIINLEKLCEDEHVSVYALKEYLYFGIWKSSLPNGGSIAFIGMSSPLFGLVNLTQHGTSERIYESPKHQVVFDDIDSKYGLCGFSAVIELRNARKSFFYEIYDELDGIWLGDVLNIVQMRHSDYVFYDIKEKMLFTWKTLALRGLMNNFLIVDVVLYDSNQHRMWSFSSPVNLLKLSGEGDYYSYKDGELWFIEKEGEHGKCIIELMKNTSTDESTIFSVKFQLAKSFINEWFGTSY